MHDIKFCKDDMIMLVALCQLRFVPRISLQSFKHVKPNFKAIIRGSSCDGMLPYVPKSSLLGKKKRSRERSLELHVTQHSLTSTLF